MSCASASLLQYSCKLQICSSCSNYTVWIHLLQKVYIKGSLFWLLLQEIWVAFCRMRNANVMYFHSLPACSYNRLQISNNTVCIFIHGDLCWHKPWKKFLYYSKYFVKAKFNSKFCPIIKLNRLYSITLGFLNTQISP